MEQDKLKHSALGGLLPHELDSSGVTVVNAGTLIRAKSSVCHDSFHPFRSLPGRSHNYFLGNQQSTVYWGPPLAREMRQ